MKVLVINGDCVQVNSSANLCHIAYINGLIESGHEVTLISADGRDYELDPSIVIPEQVKQVTYYAVTLYEKLSLKKRTNSNREVKPITQGKAISNDNKSLRRIIIPKIKKMVVNSYGVHGIYSKFVKVASAYKDNTDYDCIISVSTPPASHLLAYKLIKSGHIHGKRWIQIWEDPWYSDAYGYNRNKKIYREERRLLELGNRICYVSPLTLENQKRLYPQAAHKMYWQPLPYYYKSNTIKKQNFIDNKYGYFGNYLPEARNLEPFYRAAVQEGVEVNICGEPGNLFSSTDKVKIYPRLTLQELKPIEDDTNVLVFLCNRKGGQIPGKIYQYAVTEKTILFIMDGTKEEQEEIYQFFSPYKRFVFCDNTQEDIARAIREIENNDYGDINNRPLEEFSPEAIIKGILKGC